MTTDVRPDLRGAFDGVPPSTTEVADLERRRSRRQRRQRGASLAVGLALTLGIVGGAVTILRDPGPGGSSVASTGAVDPSLEIGPGEFWFRDATWYGVNSCDSDMSVCGSAGPDVGNAPFPYVSSMRIRLWWSPAGPAHEIDRVLEPSFFSTEEQNLFVELNGRFESREEEITEYPPGGFAEQHRDDDPAHGGLSSDPAILAEQLQARLGPDAASPVIHPTPEIEGQGADTPALVRVLQALLPNAQPSLQAALFEVASTWTGMQVDTQATDPAGRPAIRLSISTESQPHEWYFDPGTRQLFAIVETGQVMLVAEASIVPTIGDTSDARTTLVATSDLPASPIPDPRA